MPLNLLTDLIEYSDSLQRTIEKQHKIIDELSRILRQYMTQEEIERIFER